MGRSCFPKTLHHNSERSPGPDIITFNAAISACEKGGQWQLALLLFSDLRKEGGSLFGSSGLRVYGVTVLGF